MPDEVAPETTHCPWCSATIPTGSETCPSCGAALVSTAEGGVPGLTAVDESAPRRLRELAKPRGGLFGVLQGETGDTVDPLSDAELASVAPPGDAVRIEMLRIELQAENQRLLAEQAHLVAEAVADGGAESVPRELLDEVGITMTPSLDATTAPPPAAVPPGPDESSPASPPPPGPKA